MPVTNPIDGAYYDPQTIGAVEYVALNAGASAVGETPLALESNGATEYISRRALNAGAPLLAPTLLAEDIGGSQAQTPTVLSLTVDGFAAEALARTLQSLVVAPEPHYYPTFLGLDVITSAQIRAATFLGLTARGESATRHTRLSATVRAERWAATRQALAVAQFVDDASLLALEVGASQVEAVTRLALDAAMTDGFMVLADIVGAPFVAQSGPVAFYPFQDIRARLLVGPYELSVLAFDYAAAPDKLGATFNITLAAPTDLPVVALGNSFTFSLVVTVGEDEHEYILVQNGKIQGHDITFQWGDRGPGDTLSVSGFDVMADKFGLAPRRTVTMFDPNKVDYHNVETNPREGVELYPGGGLILPILEPVVGLTMMQALQRAYTGAGGGRFKTALTRQQQTNLTRVSSLITELSNTTLGLSFDRVITNIPDYPVSRADFTFEGGWHDGCQPFVGMYNPVLFVEWNTLFIVDAYRALPWGYVARGVPVEKWKALGISRVIANPFNAVLLTYQIRAEDDPAEDTYIAYRYEQNSEENGAQWGELGYQRVDTTSKIREVFRIIDNSLVSSVVEEYTQETFITTLSQVDNGPGPVTLAHREKQQDFYTEDFKTGHHKEVMGLIVTGPDASLELVKVLTEDCEITWIDDPNSPGQKLQYRSHTRYEGLVYFAEGDTQQVMDGSGEMVDAPKRYPALVAQASGIVSDDGRMGWAPIRLVTETLRATKGNQLDVMIVDVDLMTNTVKNSKSEPRSSSGLRSVNKFEVRAKTMLLRDEASEALIGPRIPQSVNAGELPRPRAIELALRVLRDGFSPPRQMRLDLPGVDFAIRRGSVVRGQQRDGAYSGPYMVTGFTIAGNNLGRTGHRISMSLEAVELR